MADGWFFTHADSARHDAQVRAKVLADVLDALRDHEGFERWAHATGRPSCYLDEVTPNSDYIADYLTARFAPTAPGSDRG